VIVEYYGDVYHCNPRRFKDESEYCPIIRRTVGEQWKRDRKRLACFTKRHGYDVVIVWESDWNKNPEKELDRIRDVVERRRNETQEQALSEREV
jgi:G:T-mismatch repair DNA endonuclease (very short patch repair protein)